MTLTLVTLTAVGRMTRQSPTKAVVRSAGLALLTAVLASQFAWVDGVVASGHLAGSSSPSGPIQGLCAAPGHAVSDRAAPISAAPNQSSDASSVTWEVVVAGESEGCGVTRIVDWDGGFAGLGGASLWLSTDGLEWRRSPLADLDPALTGSLVQIVGYGGGLVLAAPEGPVLRMWSSEDGRVWDSTTDERLATDGEVLGPVTLLVHDGRIVAVAGVRDDDQPNRSCETGPCANATRIWTSTDGVSWRSALLRDEHGDLIVDERGAPWIPGYAAIGFDRFVMPSPRSSWLASQDGHRWTDVGGTTTGRLAYRGRDGYTYALGRTPSGSGEDLDVVIRSTDLTDWHRVFRVPDASWSAMTIDAGDDGVIVAGSGDPDVAWLATSSDGLAWSVSSDEEGMVDGAIEDVAVGHGRYVAVGPGPGPTIWTRPTATVSP